MKAPLPWVINSHSAISSAIFPGDQNLWSPRVRLYHPLDARYYLTSKGIEVEALCAPLVAVTSTV